jgi:hypothetical protein
MKLIARMRHQNRPLTGGKARCLRHSPAQDRIVEKKHFPGSTPEKYDESLLTNSYKPALFRVAVIIVPLS